MKTNRKIKVAKNTRNPEPGPYSHSPQKGTPGHCFVAQVFGPKPEERSIATIETSIYPGVATATARLLAASWDLLEACELMLKHRGVDEYKVAYKSLKKAVARAKGARNQ